MSTETYITGTTGKPTIDKTVVGDLDYSFDWTAWLALVGDTIASAAFSITGGGIAHSDSVTAGVATVWVSGGASGSILALTCTIVTTASTPRTDSRTIYIKVK